MVNVASTGIQPAAVRWAVPRNKARKLLGVHEMQLRSWERQRLIPVTEVYSFTEMSALRTLVELRKQGLRPERIRLSLTAAREKMSGADPLTQARVFLHASGRIGVKTEGRSLDPMRDQYLLDFEGDIYGERMDLEILERVRGEVKFESVDALKEQIAKDVESARGMVK